MTGVVSLGRSKRYIHLVRLEGMFFLGSITCHGTIVIKDIPNERLSHFRPFDHTDQAERDKCPARVEPRIGKKRLVQNRT